jgi:GGDEF domain-containing protein
VLRRDVIIRYPQLRGAEALGDVEVEPLQVRIRALREHLVVARRERVCRRQAKRDREGRAAGVHEDPADPGIALPNPAVDQVGDRARRVEGPLEARAGEEIARARRHGGTFAVVYLDLDGFKQVNDNRSHATGDRMIERAATAMVSVLRGEDVLARVGGEEFVALLPVENDFFRLYRLRP